MLCKELIFINKLVVYAVCRTPIEFVFKVFLTLKCNFENLNQILQRIVSWLIEGAIIEVLVFKATLFEDVMKSMSKLNLLKNPIHETNIKFFIMEFFLNY